MIDEQDIALREHFSLLCEDTAHPGGWDDVRRRADDLQHGAPRTGRVSAWRRRRAALGGAAAVTAVAVTVGVLFVAGLPGRSADPAAETAETLRYTFTQPDRSGSSPSDSLPTTSGTNEIDFARRIARTRVTQAATNFESIATDEWTYVLVPPARRTMSDGKPWVRHPTEPGMKASLDSAPFTDPIGSAQKGVGVVPQGADPMRVGDEVIDGQVLTHYRARNTGGTYDFWLDDRGWLARAEIRFDDVAGTSSGTFVYDVPVVIDEPKAEDALQVADADAAQQITGS